MQSYLSLVSLLDRFWSKVERSDGCWLWTASTNSNGYGQLFVAKEPGARPIAAHRLSWMLHNGAIPERLWVLHRCDNPRCVRPDHLFLGTSDDNVADMHAKGRASAPPRTDVLPPVRRGERNGSAVLTELEVRAMRELAARGFAMRELARRFKVARGTVKSVLIYKTWSHI